jgi:hypothetical protein
VLIAVLNVKFHLFQELIDQYTVVIVLEKTNHKIPETIDTPEMIEVQDIPETIDTPEMIEVQDIPMIEIHVQVEMVLDLKIQKRINF